MSGLQWFRLYHRIVDDEKLRLLAFEDRWHFVALCCLKGDGLLDTPNDSLRSRKIAVKLGVQLRELDEIGRRLQEVDLVDANLSPVAWDELQFRSDSSQERVKRYREARKERGLVAQWQPSKALRQSVYDRDGHACVYCETTDDLSIDHKTPEMHGGTNDFDNLQTACRKCNAQKRDLTDQEYRQRLSNGAVTLQQRPKSKSKSKNKITDTEVNTDVLTAKRRSVYARKPDEISDSLWADWKKHRKTAFTETALAGLRREAAKAGWTLEASITEAIERGWQGFRADWILNNGNTGRTSNNSSGNGRTNGFAKALQQVADGPFDEPFGFDSRRM